MVANYDIFLLACILMTFQLGSCGDLLIIPSPDQNGQVTASIDAGFVLTCQATGNVHDKPKALQWITPDGQIVQPDPSQSVHTQLEGDVIRLFFDELKPRHTGMYRCTGIQASVPKEASITLILQSKQLIQIKPIMLAKFQLNFVNFIIIL